MRCRVIALNASGSFLVQFCSVYVAREHFLGIMYMHNYSCALCLEIAQKYVQHSPSIETQTNERNNNWCA